MLLSSIQVQGFKSFADKTTLKFGKGITAVVGPNGSGKSNISDAVRWVLGEQSTKSLRGQSMEDVIFSGTESRRPHGFCEVTLNIDNSDRSLNFDNDSVSVTRRYYRSHESEYLINNAVVRLRDVHELFMDTGLGRDGYSMIGQGRIDNIIRSRSDERRDIFEEAAGISKYRYRKEDAERRLKAAEENLLRLHDINDELEARVAPLAEQSRKAEHFLELAEKKKKLEIGLWIYTVHNSKAALREQENKITAAQLQYRDIEAALSEFDDMTERNTAEFARLTAAIEEERSAISSANEDIVKSEGKVSVIENDIRHNCEAVSRLENESESLRKNDELAQADANEKRIFAENETAKVKELENKLSGLELLLSDLLSDSESISRRIEEQILKLNSITAQSADSRIEMMAANSTINEISARSSVIDSQILHFTEEQSKLDSEITDMSALLSELEEKITGCKNSVSGYKLLRERKADILAEFQDRCEKTRLDIEEKKRRIKILSELESSMEGFSNSVKKVISEAEKGILRGIRGTVSKLITVDKKYAVAIETALAGAIQNIIVDSEADAKRAIQYLKANNAGRATFLPVSTIKAREFKENGFEEIYGFVGMADSLVKVDDKYSEIIRYLLGGAAVTEDIDSAAVLAKKYSYRVKVVSLDGQIISPGGSFTGGSHVKQAGLLSRSSDIKRLKEELEELSEKEADLISQRTAASEALAAIDANIAAENAELMTANEDKIRALAELKRLDGLMNSVEQNISELTSEKNEASEKINALKNTAALAADRISSLETEKSELQCEIDKMTGGRDDISEKREALTGEVTSVKIEIFECNKNADTFRASVEAIEAAADDRASKLSEISDDISKLLTANRLLEKDIENENLKAAALREKISESENAIEVMISGRNNIEKTGIELRASERERTSEREKISGELARLNERRDAMIHEYDDVIRQLYDEYGVTRSEAEETESTIENPGEAKKKLAELKGKIRSLGNVNVSAIEEYKEVSERYEFMSAQINDVETSRSELYRLINQLTAQMQELFNTAFNKINESFSEAFRELFGGGQARLLLSNPDNVLESGIDIEAKLPGKNVPSLEGLSGGEKALVALSIYFAIMQVNAPPFCFLDEVDTALDDINVDRVADYMKRSGLPTQFICVTHRRGTMEAADILYGVTMQEKGVTKLLELDVAQLEKKMLAEQL